MPAYRKKTQPEAQPILTRKRSTDLAELPNEDLAAIGRLVAAAVVHQNAIYVAPGRFGSVTIKFYIEGDQFAETLNPGDDWEGLTEEIIEALYDLKTVGRFRTGLVARASERPSETSNAGKPTPRSGRQGSVPPGPAGDVSGG
jgi:hypothetical protein